MQWWSFIRKFQMMSWTSFIFTENLQILFFWRLSLSEFHAMSEVSSWVLLRWTFLAQFLFFLVLANQSKGMSVWHQKKLLLFGRISYKIYKSWILCLTEICDSFVLLRWFLFLHRVRKILEIKLYSVILNTCKKKWMCSIFPHFFCSLPRLVIQKSDKSRRVRPIFGSTLGNFFSWNSW